MAVPASCKDRKWLSVAATTTDTGAETATTGDSSDLETKAVSFTVMTYNLLCQKLVRRDLFKYASKNSLRWKPRKDRLAEEIGHHNTDIMCLQEVGPDEWLHILAPQFKRNSYDSRIFQSLSKSHGVVVAWKKSRFSLVEEASVSMDRTMEVCGEVLNTDNVALVVVLKLGAEKPADPNASEVASEHCAMPGDGARPAGVIVSSTHLFWRPAACYQRLQQQVALLRAIRAMQDKYPGYPVISCGDFNTTPDDAGYDLLTKPRPVSLSEWQLDNLLPLHADSKDSDEDGDDKNQEADGSHASTNVFSYANVAAVGTAAESKDMARKRRKLEEQERLIDDQLQRDTKLVQNLVTAIQADNQPMRSCYDTYADLDPSYRTDQWKGEPIYTNYTSWKGTLDYIFYTPGLGLEVRKILSLPAESRLKPGLPNEVFSSDHVSILARFDFSPPCTIKPATER
ncbi:Endonuclease/exonuclease/phosphatase [Kickxella alabastrina]|uniref:Endonuclease/exonuclease/phosphatase n=1 Tax=Kickxella alabastrina TaxID=61397 RepID=UPI00221FA13A|nr:Endonuclease/exonuclease/phosphatase [Kickxella alabastrina]KAI7834226.1 Endonuclease/exonuclease/phosphatase [Kickxella alabastrina]